jgi:hypothetical protein
MWSVLRNSLLVAVLLASVPAWSGDNLPTLPSTGPAGLPSLSSSPINAIPAAEQTVSVTCYLGNPNDNNSLGSIATVASAAGAGCNSINFSCQGRCFGCYADFDLSEDICVDIAGRRFIR